MRLMPPLPKRAQARADPNQRGIPVDRERPGQTLDIICHHGQSRIAAIRQYLHHVQAVWQVATGRSGCNEADQPCKQHGSQSLMHDDAPHWLASS